MNPDNPERLNFTQRVNRQFDSVGPLGRVVLVVVYALGFFGLYLAARWLADDARPWNEAIKRWSYNTAGPALEANPWLWVLIALAIVLFYWLLFRKRR